MQHLSKKVIQRVLHVIGNKNLNVFRDQCSAHSNTIWVLFEYLKKKNIDKIECYNTIKRQHAQLPFIASVRDAYSLL